MYTVASRPFLSMKIKINDNYYQKLTINIFIRKLWYYHVILTSLFIKKYLFWIKHTNSKIYFEVKNRGWLLVLSISDIQK